MQATVPKKTKYSRNETILKIAILQRLLPLQNGQFGSKIKNAKNMPKPFYKDIRVVPCKKNAQKNTKYSRTKTILKIGQLAKAFAKWSVWVKI